MTKAEASEFKNRWLRVNDAEGDELRRTSMAEKLLQIAALMASVSSLGWRHALEDDEQQVRERWQKLREAYQKT